MNQNEKMARVMTLQEELAFALDHQLVEAAKLLVKEMGRLLGEEPEKKTFSIKDVYREPNEEPLRIRVQKQPTDLREDGKAWTNRLNGESSSAHYASPHQVILEELRRMEAERFAYEQGLVPDEEEEMPLMAMPFLRVSDSETIGVEDEGYNPLLDLFHFLHNQGQPQT